MYIYISVCIISYLHIYLAIHLSLTLTMALAILQRSFCILLCLPPYTRSMNFFRHAACQFELRASVAPQNAHSVQLAGQHRRLNATTLANGLHH